MIRSESANQLFDEDDLSKQKNQRMATLLGFSTDPSREALIDELVKKGILAQVLGTTSSRLPWKLSCRLPCHGHVRPRPGGRFVFRQR